ncbi:unnamed protein product, partial [Prorocentrum cordatum]
MAAGAGTAERDAGGEAETQHHLTTSLRPMRAARASSGSGLWRCWLWQRALGLLGEMREVRLEPNVISYSAGISACEKGEQWQRALALLSDVWVAKLEGSVIIFNAGITACGKGEQWQQALALLREMREGKLEPDIIYTAGSDACHRCGQWQQVVSLLKEM